MLKLNASVVLLALLISSCAGIKVDSNQSKGVDFKKYKTFAWVRPEDPNHESRKDDKVYSRLILELANAELLKKGFVLDTLNPEAIFIFDTRVEAEISHSQGQPTYNGYGYDGYGYYGGYYYTPTASHVSQKEYEQGMLYIDMLDAKTRVPLWGGWASAKLTAKSDVEKDIRVAVKSIFARLNVMHK
jgi:Domain of unknown function (DUF4136)